MMLPVRLTCSDLLLMLTACVTEVWRIHYCGLQPRQGRKLCWYAQQIRGSWDDLAIGCQPLTASWQQWFPMIDLRLARRWFSALWWAAFQPEKLLVGGDQTWLVLAVSITDIHWRTFAGKSAMEPHQGLYPICSSKMISYVISWYIMLVYHISFIPVLDLSAWLFDVVCMSMIGITRSTMRSQSMPLDQELLELARSRGVWVSDASGIFNNGQLMEPTWTNHNYPPGTFAIRKLGFRSQRCQPLLVYAVVDASLPWGAAPQILNGKQMHALFSFKPVVFSYEPGFIWICFYNLWLHYDFYMISIWFLYDFYMISMLFFPE